MTKTTALPLNLPTYREGTKEAIALEVFKGVLAKQPNWCRENHQDRDSLVMAIYQQLNNNRHPVGMDKARKITNALINTVCQMATQTRWNIDRPLPKQRVNGAYSS